MIRTLTLNGYEYEVDSAHGILFSSSAKFSGMSPHAVIEFDTSLAEESFGDVETIGFYWRVEKNGAPTIRVDDPRYYRHYRTDSQGFVYEIDGDDYEAGKRAEAEASEREEACENLRGELADLQAQDNGQCDECGEVVYVNGIRTHATGCPLVRRINETKKALANAEDL